MSDDTGLSFTFPVTWHDGTVHDELRGSAYVDDSNPLGKCVAFQDDYSVEGGVCYVPMSQVPALIKWLRLLATEETLQRFQGSITFNASWPADTEATR